VPVAGTDSYYLFHLADAYGNGLHESSAVDRHRFYPEGANWYPTSALAQLMRLVGTTLGVEVPWAGMLLMVPLSGLFLLPLALYLYRLKLPMAGILGGVLASLCTAFFPRSTIYRVDTDGGNLFFGWLVAACTAEVRADASMKRNTLAAAAAGVSLALFCRWYSQPALLPLFGATFLLHIALQRIPLRPAAGLSAVFLLFANPLNAQDGAADLLRYIADYLLFPATSARGAGFSIGGFPSVLREIQELQPASWVDSLGGVGGNLLFGIVGLTGFGFFAFANWRRVAPMLPLLALGFLGLFRSMRFLMYLAPFAGIGLGYWIYRIAGHLRDRQQKSDAGKSEILIYAAGAAAALIAVLPLSYDAKPQAQIHLIRSLQNLAARLPENAALLHTWGHGYLVGYATGRATFNDGFDPNPIVEQLFDRGLVVPDPAELHAIARFLAVRGRSGLGEAVSKVENHTAFLETVRSTTSIPPDPIVLVLTAKMQRQFGSYFRKGLWNFSEGRGPYEGYDVRTCRELADSRFRCTRRGKSPLEVDLVAGTLNGRPNARRTLQINNGEVVAERDFDVPHGLTLQLVKTNDAGEHEIQVIKEVVYQSNFNQMFVLGRYDPRLFRPVVEDHPVLRAFELIF